MHEFKTQNVTAYSAGLAPIKSNKDESNSRKK